MQKTETIQKSLRDCILCDRKNGYTCTFCRYACCENAETVNCVCLFAYRCIIHTKNLVVCVGSHS